jgi:uncharacterized protein with HEPN domain
MQRDRGYLLDIIDACTLAVQYVKGKSLEDFLSDIQCQDAVIRRLEIIGEAARRISDGTREAHPELPWHKMIGMRNVMIHEYDEIDLPLVWETVTKRLPDLLRSVEGLLSD